MISSADPKCTYSFRYSNEDFLFSHAYGAGMAQFSAHMHDIYELLFIKKEGVSYSLEGKNYELPKNSLVISRPLKLHSLSLKNPDDYDRYCILFDGERLASDICGQISPDVDVIRFDGNSLVCDLFKKMDYYCEHFEEETLQVVLTHLIEEVLYNVVIASKNFKQSSVYTVNPFINAAIEYMEQHITEPLTVDAVCQNLHVTKSHLHNLFVKHLKITPKKYITSKKLTMAQRELRSGLKPTEVHMNLGFTDYTTFFRDYKKYFGHAPSEEIGMKIIRRIES